MLKNIANIGEIVRNARVFNPRNWERTAMDDDNILEVVHELFALLNLRDANYVLVGGIAVLNYVSGRNTEDIDLIMALPDLDSLPEIQLQSQDRNFGRGSFQGLQIDLLFTDNPVFRAVQQKHTTRLDFLEQNVPIATVDGLLLLKLYALPSLYRQGDFARVSIYENDIASLMYAYRTNTDVLLAELTEFISSTDLASLREITVEIEHRIRRFREAQDAPGYSTDHAES